ncbi:MAG: large conductance mechanosensitive channel protein MscL [Alphaproteobacteria bacterium]|nr:large conductance mechanosensitive channel protein MscL [Alphaproteobacteria bacterium]
MAKSNFIKDFTAFISRGNAIDMAVGIIVGSVMTSVVNSLVRDVMMPPIGVLAGGIDFSDWKIALGFGTDATINIGVFLNTVISFIITMFAIFLIVRLVAKAKAKKPATTHACPYCKSMISNEATKCPYCCSAVKPVETAAPEESELTKGLKSVKSLAAGKLSKIKKITKIKKK